MKILITGAEGFIGKNLIIALRSRGYVDLLTLDADAPAELLDRYCGECGFVYHLSGSNRAKQQDELMQADFSFTDTLLRQLNKHKNRCPVMFASSTHAALPNLYGRSKKAGEELLELYANETGATVYVYRFPHVFGKWAKPNYNSVIATFCYNVAHDLPIVIHDENAKMHLAYVDDVAESLCDLLDGKTNKEGAYCVVPQLYTATLGDIAKRIRSFRNIRESNLLPDMTEPLTRKLYATYLSFLPVMEFAYPLEMLEDADGSETEFLRLSTGGQITVSVCKPGMTRGNHWHHTRAEKILAVSGSGVIKFRRIDMDEVIEYPVSAKKHVAVDIPIGYAHCIENTGKSDLVLLSWSSECCDGEGAEGDPSEVVIPYPEANG
ncbi:MAG: capsular biosynthesis protein [Firmicutes bacterium HGW-Firmicutes-9]|jgi:UDP-2-acetamido-2,6-beta-L-arabino-hexul-4-ose reductase|nr:MAG: capsular biosynthesis protein [Firmicutes bacterium HGW-Firmicutes-9]